MAVLTQCFCLSLRQGSFLIGVYSLVVYCVAFAVELWWSVESLLILPAPAYTLCTLYFFNFLMAAFLLFGLLVRQRRYLMSWTLMTVLSFFPEAGMVLFMSLYYWPGHKYEYGVIELIYWSIRAMFNIFGSVCVCSLYLTWRDEELILERIHDLTLGNVEVGSQSLGTVLGSGSSVYPISVIGVGSPNGFRTLHRTRDLNLALALHNRGGGGTLKSNTGLYNYGYDPDVKCGVNLNPLVYSSSRQGSCGPGTCQRGLISALMNWCRCLFCLPARRRASVDSEESVVALQYRNQMLIAQPKNSGGNINTTSNNLRASLLRMKSEFDPGQVFDYGHKRAPRLSHLGIAGMGLEPEGMMSAQNGLRSRSLWNLHNDDFWSRPPLSRPVSMVNYIHLVDQNNDMAPAYNKRHSTNAPRFHSQTHLNMMNGTMRSQYKIQHHRPSAANMKKSFWENDFTLHGRRAQSVDALNNAKNSLFGQRYYGHHDYGEWSKTSVDEDEYDESYQDIPL